MGCWVFARASRPRKSPSAVIFDSPAADSGPIPNYCYSPFRIGDCADHRAHPTVRWIILTALVPDDLVVKRRHRFRYFDDHHLAHLLELLRRYSTHDANAVVALQHRGNESEVGQDYHR